MPCKGRDRSYDPGATNTLRRRVRWCMLQRAALLVAPRGVAEETRTTENTMAEETCTHSSSHSICDADDTRRQPVFSRSHIHMYRSSDQHLSRPAEAQMDWFMYV